MNENHEIHRKHESKSKRVPSRRPVHDEVLCVKGDSRRFERLPPFAVLYARSPLVEEVEDAAVCTFIAASAGNQPGQLRFALPFLADRLFTRGASTPDVTQFSPLNQQFSVLAVNGKVLLGRLVVLQDVDKPADRLRFAAVL